MITLRPWTRDDAPALLAARSSVPDLDRQLPLLADLDAAREHCARLAADDVIARVVEAEGAFAGAVMASNLDDVHGTTWISYWLLPEFRGRGIAAAALRGLAAALLASRFERLELGARANNPASIRVAQAAGFVREGIERQKLRYGDARFDVVTFARLRSDPVPTGSVATLVPGGTVGHG